MGETIFSVIKIITFLAAIMIQVTALPIYRKSRLAKRLNYFGLSDPFQVTILSVSLILWLRLICTGWNSIFFTPITLVYGILYAKTTVSQKKLFFNQSLINQLIFTTIIFILAVGLQFDFGDGSHGWLVCGFIIKGDLYRYFEHNGPQYNSLYLLVHSGLWVLLRHNLKTGY